MFDHAAEEAGPSSDPQGPQELKLGFIESHWQTETDYYAATVVLDFLSFAFVALFYQVPHFLEKKRMCSNAGVPACNYG